MDFLHFIHVNKPASVPAVDVKVVAEEVDKIFPICKIDIRPPFRYQEKMIERAKIVDIKQPDEKGQPEAAKSRTRQQDERDGFNSTTDLFCKRCLQK